MLDNAVENARLNAHSACPSAADRTGRRATFTNCLNGHYSANFLFGNADSRIAELPHMHNILRRSLAPLYILRLLRAHTMPSIVLLVFTVLLLYAVTSIIVRV